MTKFWENQTSWQENENIGETAVQFHSCNQTNLLLLSLIWMAAISSSCFSFKTKSEMGLELFRSLMLSSGSISRMSGVWGSLPYSSWYNTNNRFLEIAWNKNKNWIAKVYKVSVPYHIKSEIIIRPLNVEKFAQIRDFTIYYVIWNTTSFYYQQQVATSLDQMRI